MRALPTALLVSLALAACGDAIPTTDTTPESPSATQATLRVEPLRLPTPPGAAQPDLVTAPDGTLLLSWIEPAAETGHALRFSRLADGAWAEPRTIASGDDWFVNWADTPHIAATADGALWAHWLRKSAAATYAYDVALARSADGGATWSDPVLVNTDGTPTEHGFVSMWPHGDDGLGIAWLDGREMHPGTGHHGADHHGHPAAMMTLRTARFDATLSRHDERVLDRSVCDCCQTDSATTARGQLLVYRDRTGGEIRDIHAARLGADGWSTPARVHADDWEMPACPVNGPSVAARGDHVVVGWYTAAGDRPRVLLARSTDAGASFGPPVELDAGDHVQGRVAVALDGGRAWALWTTEAAGRQSIRLATLPADLAGVEHRTELARLAGRGRATGFAQLVVHDGMATAAWTDVIDRQPALRAARIRP